MIDFEQILALKDQLSRRLVGPMETNFIHGIAVGIMERADDYCLRLYVSKMIDRREFDAIVRPTIIPKEIIVEIILAEKATFCANSSISEQQIHTKLKGGISTICSSNQYESGTIGYFCESTKTGDSGVFILSCNHVFANYDFSPPFHNENRLDDGNSVTIEKIFQPSTNDNINNNQIAELFRVQELREYPFTNQIDGAIAKLEEDFEFDLSILSIGKVQAWKDLMNLPSASRIKLLKRARLYKNGRTTSKTEGMINNVSIDLMVGYSDKWEIPNQGNITKIAELKFVNQFQIKPVNNDFADEGDSGALVVIKGRVPEWKKTTAVGLLFAKMEIGGVSYGIANHLRYVYQQLQIKLIL